ncbi:MAG: hypothetical protein PHI99_03355 [Syntrophales bacterium]|nr:hypothetical protein [Syntrophales bacterium]
MVKVIQIPTINDAPADLERLFSLWNQANDYSEEVRFDFSHCRFLRPNAVAFLGGLAKLIESRPGTAVFDWESVRDGKILINLRQNGFAGMFGQPYSGWTGHSIPYREDRFQDVNAIMDYLTHSWLGRGWVHVSERLSTVNHKYGVVL